MGRQEGGFGFLLRWGGNNFVLQEGGEEEGEEPKKLLKKAPSQKKCEGKKWLFFEKRHLRAIFCGFLHRS